MGTVPLYHYTTVLLCTIHKGGASGAALGIGYWGLDSRLCFSRLGMVFGRSLDDWGTVACYTILGQKRTVICRESPDAETSRAGRWRRPGNRFLDAKAGESTRRKEAGHRNTMAKKTPRTEQRLCELLTPELVPPTTVVESSLRERATPEAPPRVLVAGLAVAISESVEGDCFSPNDGLRNDTGWSVKRTCSSPVVPPEMAPAELVPPEVGQPVVAQVLHSC
jgi:hypothetical protein